MQRTTFDYDPAGQLTTTHAWTDASGLTVTRTNTYDAWGNRTTSTDASGAVSTTTFDTTHHLFAVQTTHPAGEVTSQSWDAACAAVTQVTDANGQSTTHEYDAFCRPVRSDGPLGTFKLQAFLDWGSPTAQRIRTELPSPTPGDGTGNAFATVYLDGWGRAWRNERKAAQAGHTYVTDRGFDARGNLAWTTQPYDSALTPAAGSTFHYDALDRAVRMVLPDAHEATLTYGLGRQTAIDPLGHAVTSVFDAYGRVVRSEEDDDQGRTLTTRYTYNLRGELAGVVDPAGNEWSWTHDLLGREVSNRDPDAGTWTIAYDVPGRRLVQTDAKGQLTELRFDAAGRLLTKLADGVVVASLAYGEPRAGYFNVGRLTTMSDAHGSERTDYDALGREVRVTRTLDGVDYTLTRRFTASGQLAGVSFPDGDAFGTPANPLRYDAAGRLTAVPRLVEEIVYDPADRPLQRTHTNGTLTSWQYHDRGWLTDIVTQSSAGPIQNLHYSADASGRVVSVTSPFDNESWSYAYDALGRLVSATNLWNPAHSQTFAWDAAGNLAYNSRVGLLSYPSPGMPRPHAPTAVAGAAMTYDGNGNLLTGRGRTITWNADNLPSQIDGAVFSYDGFGTRVKTVTPGATRLHPLGDDYEVAGGVVTKYLSLAGMGVVAKRVGNTSFWLHTDRLGSVQAISDAAGAVVQRRTYRPFGAKLADATAFSEALGFIGQRHDEETGLSFLHARYYDAELGLFLSPDPAQADLSSYRYAAGDPVNFSDPTGLDPIHVGFCYPSSNCSGAGGGFYSSNTPASSTAAALLAALGSIASDFWHGLFGGGKKSADREFWDRYFAAGHPSSPLTSPADWMRGKFGGDGDALGGGDGGGGGMAPDGPPGTAPGAPIAGAAAPGVTVPVGPPGGPTAIGGPGVPNGSGDSGSQEGCQGGGESRDERGRADSWNDWVNKPVLAWLDGIIPGANPFEFYYSDLPEAAAGQEAGEETVWTAASLLASTAALRGAAWASKFRHFRWLNQNRYLRIGQGHYPGRGRPGASRHLPQVRIGSGRRSWWNHWRIP